MLRTKISYKLFITFFLILLLVVAAIAISREILTRNFRRYIEPVETEQLQSLLPQLQAVYRVSGSWAFIDTSPAYWQRHFEISPIFRRETPPPFGGPLRHTEPRLMLFDEDKHKIFGPPHDTMDVLLPIQVNGATVGWVGMARRYEIRRVPGLPPPWLEQQSKQLLLLGGFVIFATAAIAWALSRNLLRPIRQLTEGTRALANRNFQVSINSCRSDELGQLAHNFNRMATTLQQYENMRRQWLSDISHELRTPLAVLRGEVEALQDGIRQPTPENLGSLHNEILRISRLVDDLHQLSLSDACVLTMEEKRLPVEEVIEQTVQEFQTRFSQLKLNCVRQPQDEELIIIGDRNRLGQVFRNIFENCCRYVDRPGTIQIICSRRGEQVFIAVDDSGPGVPAEALPRLFDRLFRVDHSRCRESGGSGLGLSICRHIIEHHKGTITADHALSGGLRIAIILPLASADPTIRLLPAE